MVYESTIAFTLDTICPWTYLAKKRLDEALRRFRSSEAAKDVTFTIKYFPFQLYPEASQEGEDKYEWYKRTKYDNDPERMKMYTTLMAAHGVGSGINFRFDGTVASTLHAHRLVQHYQEKGGPEVADRIVNSLYHQYFSLAQHPSSPSTLVAAAEAGGIPRAEAEAFVADSSEGMPDVKKLLEEQKGNGVDAVPFMIFEGRKRDFSLEGAREVEEYERELEKVVREAR